MFDRFRPAPRLLLALLAVDLLLILLHGSWVWLGRQGVTPPPPNLVAITRDLSIPEFFNYAKWIAIVVMLGLAWRRSGWPTLAAFAVIYGVVFLDDALSIHETVGVRLAVGWGLPDVFGLRAQDLGELAIWSVLGALLLAMLAWGFVRSPEEGRKAGRTLGLLFGALIVCAVGADMVHVTLSLDSVLEDFFSFFEDGGEMIVGSVTLAYVATLPLRLRAEAAPATSQLA